MLIFSEAPSCDRLWRPWHWQGDLNPAKKCSKQIPWEKPSSPVWIYWLGLVLWGSCALPVGPVEGFVMGEGDASARRGGVEVCVFVCAFGEQKAKAVYRETVCTTPCFSYGAAACLCKSNRWTDVGLCVCLLRRKTLLQHSPPFLLEMHRHTTPGASNVSATSCFWSFCCPAKYFHWYSGPDLL